MSKDYFTDAPTTGSHDHQVSAEEWQLRVHHLERRLGEAQEQIDAKKEKKPRKIRWKKIRKFFITFVIPVLIFIPQVLNALANYKKANAKFA